MTRSCLTTVLPMILAAVPIGCAPGERAGKDGLCTAADGEARILGVIEQMYKEEFGLWNVPREDGRVLRLLAECTGARHIVEIGTSNGCSALWFCLALRATGGRLTTHEIDDYRAGLARENFKKAGVEDIVTLIEGDAHKEVTRLEGPIDILFLDADKSGHLDYLRQLLPLVRPGGLIIAHNTTDRADEMEDYLAEVTTNPALETVFLHEQAAGLGVTLKKR